MTRLAFPRAAVLAACLFAAPAFAQTDPPPAAPPPDSTVAPETPETTPAPTRTVAPPPVARTYAGDDTTLALPLVVDVRSRRELDGEQQRMAELKAVSLRRVSEQRALEVRRKAQVDIKKSEIAGLKIRIDLAKKEKRTADQKDLEAQRKRLEAQQRYLERLRDWHAAEASFQQAFADYAQARVDEAKVEARVDDLGDLSAAESRQRVEARNAFARMIAAVKSRADKGTSLANAERTAADRRKAVLDAYTEMNKN
jgi:hypothetical protein